MNQDDIIVSLSYFLFENFKDEMVASASSARRRDGEKRPFFRIENAKHQVMQTGLKGFIDQHIWYVWYYGLDEGDSRKIVDRISQIVNTQRKIQGYLVNHKYQSPSIESRHNDLGMLSEGDRVRVSAIAKVIADDRGTVASDEAEVTVGSGDNSVRLYLPKNPTMKTIFDWYDIYAAVGDGVLKKQNTQPIRHYDGSYTSKYQNMVLDLHEVTTTGDDIPENDNEVVNAELRKTDLTPFFKLYVMDSKIELMQHEKDNDLWDARVELMTHSRGELVYSSPPVTIKNFAVRGFVDTYLFMNLDRDANGVTVTYETRGVHNPKIPILGRL